VLCFNTSLTVFLSGLSRKDVAPGELYSPSTAVVLAELLKLFFCSVALAWQVKRIDRLSFRQMLQCTAKMDESEQDSDSGPAGTGHISGVEKLSVFLLLTSTMILKTPSLNPKGSLHTEKYRANLGCPVGVGTRGPWPCWDTRCPGALCNVHVPHAHRESQLDVSIHLVKTRLQEKAYLFSTKRRFDRDSNSVRLNKCLGS
jgi:hypothetical protein